jgi:surface antigen
MTNNRTKSKPRMAAIVVVAALALTGCQAGPRQATGTLVGAGLGAGFGGLIGSHFGHGTGAVAGAMIGTFAGAVIGSEIGRSMDQADRAQYEKAAAQAQTAPVGETVNWNNPESGNYGSITPTSEGIHRESGAYCREYQQEIVVGGKVQHGYGQACRQPDGSWKII